MARIAHKSTRMDFAKNSFGVRRWEYHEKLDEIDLLIEIGILSNCKIINRCRPCRFLLRHAIDFCMIKWDKFCFINFFDALKIIKQNNKLFKSSIVLDHYIDNKELIKKIIKLFRYEKSPNEAIRKYRDFFIEAIGKNEKIKQYIHDLVKNRDIIKFPNSLKGVLYTSSIAPPIIFGAIRSTSAPPVLIA